MQDGICKYTSRVWMSEKLKSSQACTEGQEQKLQILLFSDRNQFLQGVKGYSAQDRPQKQTLVQVTIEKDCRIGFTNIMIDKPDK